MSPWAARRTAELMAACQALGAAEAPNRPEAQRVVDEKLRDLTMWVDSLEVQAASAEKWRRKAEGFPPPPWEETKG